MISFYTKLSSLTFMLVLALGLLSQTFAQQNSLITRVSNTDAVEGQPIEITVELVPASSIRELDLLYRKFGQTEWKVVDFVLSSTKATATIPGKDVSLPSVEYYVLASLENGNVESYPIGAGEGGQPLSVQVRSAQSASSAILILSPEPNEVVAADKMNIIISLLKLEGKIDNAKTRIFIGSTEVTEYALFADDLIIFSAENYPGTLPSGKPSLSVQTFNSEGNAVESFTKSLDVRANTSLLPFTSSIPHSLSIQTGTRYENQRDRGLWYNNFALQAGMELGDWEFDADIRLSSEEKGFLQPVNRYTFTARSSWLTIAGGDYFPELPSLILSGKRVRGFTGVVNTDYFKLTTTIGEVNRPIDGQILTQFPANFDTLGTNIVPVNDSVLAKILPGTYKRQIIGVRPAFKYKEFFEWGFSYFHAIDETGSIRYGLKPRENLVAGTDISINLDDRRILLQAQTALSVVNNDITTGTFTDEVIDSVFGPGKQFSTNPQDIKDLRDLVKSFFTVNQFISPLSPQELTSMAFEGSLSLNYFNNFLKTSYIRRGHDYNSYGSPYLRNDIQGYSIQDRLRLLNNTLFISGGFEVYTDNLKEIKPFTATFSTISTSVAYFPGFDLPGITVGFNSFVNTNEAIGDSAVSPQYLIDDATNRYSVQLSYNLKAGITHQTSLNFSISDRDDQSLSNNDGSNTSVYLSALSRWTDDLSSSFNFGLNNATFNSGDYNYFTLYGGVRYTAIPERLFTGVSISPSFGDFKRISFDVDSEYFIFPKWSILGNFRYNDNADYSDDLIFSLSTRFIS